MLSVSANDKSPVTLPENNESKLVVNELLCLLTNKYDNHPIVHFVSCQKVDNRAFLVKSVKFSAQSHKSV